MRKQFDRAAAEAFACLTPIQSACYHYMTSNFNEHYQIALRNYFMPVLLLDGVKPKYVELVVMTALAELTYPIPTNGDKYTWSGCQRAAYAGISQSTWSDNKLCKSVNFIIDAVRSNADAASREIQLQMMTHQ